MIERHYIIKIEAVEYRRTPGSGIDIILSEITTCQGFKFTALCEEVKNYKVGDIIRLRIDNYEK